MTTRLSFLSRPAREIRFLDEPVVVWAWRETIVGALQTLAFMLVLCAAFLIGIGG